MEGKTEKMRLHREALPGLTGRESVLRASRRGVCRRALGQSIKPQPKTKRKSPHTCKKLKHASTHTMSMRQCVNVCQCVCPSFYSSVCLFVRMLVCLSIYLPIYPYLSTYLSIYLSICRSIYRDCWLTCLFVGLFVCLSVCPSACRSIRVSVRLFGGLSVFSVSVSLSLPVPMSVTASVSVPVRSCLFVCGYGRRSPCQCLHRSVCVCARVLCAGVAR